MTIRADIAQSAPESKMTDKVSRTTNQGIQIKRRMKMMKKKNKHNTMNPRLCALRIADPPQFVKEVSEALKKRDGNVAKAAVDLDVQRRTLFMWIKAYAQLKNAVKAARSKAA